MKKIKLLVTLSVIALTFYSCEDTLTNLTNAEIALELEGQWSVDENSSIFKSVMQTYKADIFVSDTDDSTIEIFNFYGINQNAFAVAQVNGYNLTLAPGQKIDSDYTIVSGNATISKNFKTINWTFLIDDGSGEYDQVIATYTYDNLY
jgi:hypothetical protein